MSKITQNHLSESAMADLLSAHPNWRLDGGCLVRKWQFRHFRAGFAFLTEAALLFEKQNHHGDVSLTYRHVQITLTSHDVAGLTDRDARMVAALDKITDGDG